MKWNYEQPHVTSDLQLRSDTDEQRQDNIWRPSFLSSNGPLTVVDSVMKNNITATVVARNLLTPKDNMIISKRSDESVILDSLALSVQCAGSVSNMGQCLLAQTRQVESLMVEVASLKQEIRELKHENRVLHVLANNYSTSMKRKLDQLQEFESRIQIDHQRFVARFRKQLMPSLSSVLPSTGVLHDQSPVPPPSRVFSSIEASHEQPL
ncbi:unnamed protein product [Malus baccata var. baccata]